MQNTKCSLFSTFFRKSFRSLETLHSTLVVCPSVTLIRHIGVIETRSEKNATKELKTKRPEIPSKHKWLIQLVVLNFTSKLHFNSTLTPLLNSTYQLGEILVHKLDLNSIFCKPQFLPPTYHPNIIQISSRYHPDINLVNSRVLPRYGTTVKTPL